MLRIETETRIIENVPFSPCTYLRRWFSDEFADEFMAKCCPEIRDKFVIRPKGRILKAGRHAEKPALQAIIETATPEEIQAAEENDRHEQLEIAVKRKGIDLTKEMESWLGTVTSASSQRTYRSGITNHFLTYCKEHGIDPMMVSPKEVKVFVHYLIDSGESNPLIRSVISSCKKLFVHLWENHEIPSQTNPFILKSLWPAKKRVKDLIVPNRTDVDSIMGYARKNPTVHNAIKLIVKHGMRIGAFEKMKVRGKKAVTESKGKKHTFEFDDEDLALLKTTPLNKYDSKRLGGRVNSLLNRAYQNGIVNDKYSAHDFRHYFAVEYYKKHEAGLDHSLLVRKLSKKLGHNNVLTTENYLESLNKESLQDTVTEEKSGTP